jgi:hypothetical protein
LSGIADRCAGALTMGIEAIVGLAIAAAGTGYQIHSSREAARESKDVRRDQAYQAGRRQAELSEAQQANDATAAARLARLRQRAALASNTDYGDTIKTGPMGLSATQAAPTGPQPLKKLGA